MPLSARYAYAPTVAIELTASREYTTSLGAALTVSGYNGGPCAAVSANVSHSANVTASTWVNLTVGGVTVTYGAYLADCNVHVAAVGHGGGPNAADGSQCNAVARFLGGGGPSIVVSGGTWTAAAYAVASGASYASAEALVSGFASDTVVSGAVVTLIASAAAHIAGPNGSEWEGEYIWSGGTTCSQTILRAYSASVVTSTYIDTGCRP